ncbi:MAG: DUF3710 domain-containing protein [Geodermatophilaceae bacterium]
MPIGRRRRLDRSVREKGVAPEPETRVREHESTRGPYDFEDLPDDSLSRVDLGALQVPAVPGSDLRLDVSNTGAIVAATLRLNGSAMQLGAFAAPRHTGIWSEIRAEIIATLDGQGGSAVEDRGRFGPEIKASLVTNQGPQPARFLGVDGPRWFLRALITGPAASDPASAKALERIFRNVVVVRGTDPMAVREQLPLRLPPEAAAAAAAAEDPGSDENVDGDRDED